MAQLASARTCAKERSGRGRFPALVIPRSLRSLDEGVFDLDEHDLRSPDSYAQVIERNMRKVRA
jgi:hypothetical protein